jgi:Ca2+-binding EF-hand superfamily protein
MGIANSICGDSSGVGAKQSFKLPSDRGDKRAVKWSKAVKFHYSTPEFNRQVTMRKELLDGLFLLVDQNNDGHLSLEELAKVMPNAKDFISVVDTNADNLISDKEFKIWADRYIIRFLPDIEVDRMNKLCALAAMGKIKKNGLDVKATELFDSIDIDSDGFLTRNELMAVLGDDAVLFVKSLDNIAADGKVCTHA